jgi:WD40 repeat protein
MKKDQSMRRQSVPFLMRDQSWPARMLLLALTTLAGGAFRDQPARAADTPRDAPPTVKVTPGPVIDCTTIVTLKDGRQAEYGRNIRHVGFSPDGKSVVTHTELDVRLWSAATGKALIPPIRPSFSAETLAFRADGKALLSVGYGCMQLFDTATGKPCHDLADARVFPGLEKSEKGGHYNATSAAFSPGGPLLLVGDRTSSPAKVFNSVRGHEISRCEPQGTVRQVALGAVGDRLIAACSSLRDDAKGETRLWWAANGESIATLVHDHEVYALAFTPDGTVLLTASARRKLPAVKHNDGTVRLWDGRTGKPIGQPWQAPEELERLCFRPNGKEILAAVGVQAATRDVVSGKQRHVFVYPHSGRMNAAVWSPDGKYVLTAGGAGSTHGGSLQVWDAETGHPGCAPVAHPYDVESLAISPDGRTAVTGCLGKVRLWNIDSINRSSPTLEAVLKHFVTKARKYERSKKTTKVLFRAFVINSYQSSRGGHGFVLNSPSAYFFQNTAADI